MSTKRRTELLRRNVGGHPENLAKSVSFDAVHHCGLHMYTGLDQYCIDCRYIKYPFSQSIVLYIYISFFFF